MEAARPDLAAEFDDEHKRAEALKLVLRATFPNLGSGQTDLYKAFAWANYALCGDGGRLGIVLPRSAVSDAGMANWRNEVVGITSDNARIGGGGSPARISVATVINHRGWVFEGVHNSYTVALVAVTRSSRSSPASTPGSGRSTESTADTRSRWSRYANSTGELSRGGGFDGDPDEPHVAIYPGPASSLSQYRELVDGKPELIPVSEFTRWSNTAAFPQIPTRPAFRVWRKIKSHPRFDGTDLHTHTAGDSVRYRETSTRPPTDIDSSTTMALPPSRGTPRDPRPREVRERRWRFRPVREFDATHDRFRFMNDDGAAARATGRQRK